MTLTDLPIEVQRIIIGNLTDHNDIESMSHVNKTFQHLCDEDDVWRNLCHYHFTAVRILILKAKKLTHLRGIFIVKSPMIINHGSSETYQK